MPDRAAPHRTADQIRRWHGSAPVRVATLLADGLTEGRLRAAVRAGLLVRVRHGVLALAPTSADTDAAQDAPTRRSAADASPRRIFGSHEAAPQLVRRTQGALAALGPEAVIGDAYAGAPLHLPTPRPDERPPHQVTVLVPDSGWHSGSVIARSAEVAAPDRTLVDGVPCTSLERTALDLARGRRLAECLVVLDAALRARVLADAGGSGTADELVADPARVAQARTRLTETYDRLAPVWHSAALRTAVELADPRAETALESASRGLLQASLPAPDLQVWVCGDDGRWYRADLGWSEQRVLGEADGRVKYTDPQVLWDEKRRQDAILATGEWRALVRWTAPDVWRTPARFLTRIRRALDC